MEITLDEVVTTPRFGGGCFFCGQPLGTFGANVSARDSRQRVRVVGYACHECVSTYERTGALPGPPQDPDQPPAF